MENQGESWIPLWHSYRRLRQDYVRCGTPWVHTSEANHGNPFANDRGQKYFYVVETTNAPGTSGYLQIRNSRAVPTSGSAPCFLHENGKRIPVPCPKGF